MSFMGEELLGGVVGYSFWRRTSPISNYGINWGYGIYFTEARLIGVSYRKITSQAFRIGFKIFGSWLGLVGIVFAYDWLTNFMVLTDPMKPYAILVALPIFGL